MRQKLIWISIFATSMGFFEAVVVIYLRKIMYPAGFAFPLSPIEQGLAVTEVLREAATLLILLSTGILAGRYAAERFAWFIYCFAIWDIFYYVFLKLMIGWPDSFMTWDILFLIPATWVGPVITPVIVSLSMIGLAVIILFFGARGRRVVIKTLEWTGFISGSFVLVLAFIWDYSSFILSHFTVGEIFDLENRKALQEYAINYIPRQFNWLLFISGMTILVVTTFFLTSRLKRQSGR